MNVVTIDCNGMRCPQPVLMLATKAPTVAPGSIIQISGDCPTFEADIRQWAARSKKTILSVMGTAPKLTIQLIV